MTMIVEYGRSDKSSIKFVNVQQDVEQYTGLKVIEIKVHVSDVMSKRDWQDQATGKPNTDQSTINGKLNSMVV